MKTTQENRASEKGFAVWELIAILAFFLAVAVGMGALGAYMYKDEAQAWETSVAIGEDLRADDRFTHLEYDQ